MRIKFFALIVVSWGLFIAVRWVQLHAHLNVHLDYDMLHHRPQYHLRVVGGSSSRLKRTNTDNNIYDDDDENGDVTTGSAATKRAKTSFLGEGGGARSESTKDNRREMINRSNDNNNNNNNNNNKAMVMGSGSQDAESSSFTSSSEDEDAVDIAAVSNNNNNNDDADGDGSSRSKNNNEVIISATTWAAEVLEAVRSINEGATTFEDAHTRFEMFAKAGYRLTKISMSDVFASLKRQARGKRFDVDVAREKLDAYMKAKGDRGLTADVAKDDVLRHLAHEMHAAIVQARVSTRPPPAAQYKPDSEFASSFGKLEELARTAKDRQNAAESSIHGAVEELKNAERATSNLDVNDDENLENIDLTEGLSPQSISSAMVLDKAEVAMISERRSEQLFAAGIIGEWSDWGACVRIPGSATGDECQRTRTFAHSRNFGRCFKLEKNVDLMSREKMIESLGFAKPEEVNNCMVKPQTMRCDCSSSSSSSSSDGGGGKDLFFTNNKAALDADADVIFGNNKAVIETKCLVDQLTDAYGYAERFVAAHKAHDDAKTAKSASSPMRLRWPLPNATALKVDPQLVNLEITKDTFECVGNVGAGERKRAYVTTVAPGPNGNDAIWRFFFHPMLVKLLPQSETISKKRPYKTCAVVANSGLMLKHEYGEEIDQHDGVFRINYPPVKKFSKHVGSRTTHDIVNMHHAQRLGFNDARTLRINDPDVCDAKVCLGTLIKCRMKGCHAEPLIFKQEEDIDLTDPNWRRREMLKKMKKPENSRLVLYETTLSMAWRRKFIQLILRRFKPPMTSLLSPDFIVRANALWNSVSKDALSEAAERGEQTPNCALTAQRAKDAKENWRKRRGAISISNAMNQEESCKPNSGWFAIVAAAQQCDKVTLYGFSAWKKDNNGSKSGSNSKDKSLDKDDVKYHYFDDVPGVDTVHSFELTLESLRLLQNAYPAVLDIREERELAAHF